MAVCVAGAWVAEALTAGTYTAVIRHDEQRQPFARPVLVGTDGRLLGRVKQKQPLTLCVARLNHKADHRRLGMRIVFAFLGIGRHPPRV